MRLSTFADGSGEALGLNALAADAELASDIQGQLKLAGLLDPPVDGQFGAVSQWALAAFAKRKNLGDGNTLTRALAGGLLDASIADSFALKPDVQGDLAAKIVLAMQRRGYWICRHPGCFNIVYVEGMDPDGKANDDAPDQFNDTRLLIEIDQNGKPHIAGAWEATTEPGRHYTESPLEPEGAARIAFSQPKAWQVGIHPGSKPHEALIQVRKITIYRDLNKDYKRTGDKTYTGLFGINQHHGYNQAKVKIGKASAGCLVGREIARHEQFMALVKSDLRYRASSGYTFMTAILPVSALSEESFDPADEH